ncbi:MAG: adenylate/guanylate cyclase domain-containing protein, partial [Saprospiraceae bacterium]|nr:adenylate/guanylate cyclase domain-containing protein [Saprospiraceae bacterium]
MTSSRRLVAIMFTDIAGYSSLMGQSEQNALTLLSRNRTIHERRIAEYKGALLKEMGDGILASFPSSSDAVACALTIQKDCIKEHINLRIGIHQGEVVFEKKDVYGDGVNVAARVEKLGIPGSILITKATRDQIRNKAEFGTTLLGNYLLKNIDEEITIYAIEQEGIITPKSDQVFATYVRRNQPSEKPKKPFPPLLAAALLFGAMLLFYLIFYFNWNDDASSAINSERLTQNSLAVLPFANMSRSADEDYFVDGMMEEILNRLFQVADLTIISRTSSMKYKNSSLSTREIAQELGVGNLLEGSVRTDEDRVRISIKLIDGNADTTRWLETYDRQLEDIFELQSAIAYEVATKLKSEIGGDMAERMEYATTEDPEVWKLFMRAKYSETNEDDFQTADSLLRRAIEIEPSFAPAYAELGYLWLWRGSYMGDLEPGEILDMVFSNLNRASTLDPDYP